MEGTRVELSPTPRAQGVGGSKHHAGTDNATAHLPFAQRAEYCQSAEGTRAQWKGGTCMKGHSQVEELKFVLSFCFNLFGF